MKNSIVATLLALAPIHVHCGGNAPASTQGQEGKEVGSSVASASTAKPAPALPEPKSGAFDPLTHPQPLLEASKPVAVLKTWARDLLEHAKPTGVDGAQDAPNKLRSRLAAAEQAGDPAAFAACLQLSSDRELPWASALLLTQVRIRIADTLVQETRKRFGPDSDYTKAAGAFRSALRLLMQDAFAGGRSVPGIYLPNGALMFRIQATTSGWFVVPGGYDEVYEQPRKNIPPLLRDVSFSMIFLERVRGKAEVPEIKVLYGQLVEASNALMVRAQEELDNELLGGAYACPDCGIRSSKRGVCDNCKMFR